MKKANAAPAVKENNEAQTQNSTQEHVHASNCGHKSFMHGSHVDYLQDGRYFYMLDGKAYPCSGPGTPLPNMGGSSGKGAVVLQFPSNGKKK